ncbi:hypothetical protein [Pseudomonas sp. DWP3-1-2]|uniref:hypothetical protein n=1 Tax=Pseudomonas sp. DWP3-1-2 TaxID=2804645 RepID=UPI003CEEA277
MSTESEEGRRIVASLARRVDGAANATQVADAIIAMLQEISGVLVPILGPKGVAALYRRSLYLSTSLHPLLASTFESLAGGMNLMELKSLLIQLKQADALFFGEEFLKAFHELLATLIGPSLSARLLRDVWDNSLSAPPAQETSP